MTDERSASDAPPWWAGAPLALTGGYLFMLLAGVVVLRLPGATIRGNEMSFERAVFTAVDAATLTGFQQAVALDEYGASGRACVLALTVGGMLFALLLGGIALNRAIRLPYTDGQVIRATLITAVFAIACGTAFLAEPTRGLLPSATQAASALGNSGLFLGHLPGVADWRTHAALLPLAVLGGLSIPVIMELTDGIFRRRRLSPHALTVLSLSAAVYLVGLIVLFPWNASFTGGANRIALASAMSLDARSAGFPFVAIGSMSRVAQWILIVLMLIGSAPGGSGGGMKVTGLFHLFRGTRRALSNEPVRRITGIAAVWIVAYLCIVLLTLLGLLATLPDMPADRLVFLSASAVGNVGLSHDPLAPTGGGLFVLCAAMFIGRLAPLAVLWWTAVSADDADVAVG